MSLNTQTHMPLALKRNASNVIKFLISDIFRTILLAIQDLAATTQVTTLDIQKEFANLQVSFLSNTRCMYHYVYLSRKARLLITHR